MRYCFVTALGPNRPEAFGIWQRAVSNIPETMRHDCRYIVVIDDPMRAVEDVRPVLKRAGVADYAILTNPRRYDLLDAKDVANHLAAIWNRVKYLLHGVVMSLEHDVLPEPTDFLQIADAVENGCAAVVGCPILGRARGHLMVYRLKSKIPFDIDRRHRVEPASAPAPVGSVSLGLAAISADVAKACDWSGTPNLDGSGGYGHEWSLMRHCVMMKRDVFCHWNVRPKHFYNETDFRQYGSGN